MSEPKLQPLATVNGHNIYPDDLNQLLMGLPPQVQMQFNSREGRRNLLDELISHKLMMQDAIDNNLEETEEFQTLLDDAKEKILTTLAINNLMKDLTVEEDEVKKFYDDNPGMFIAPESVRASHILVPDIKQAEKIIDELEKDEISFEDAAKKYSTCPSAPNGGDLNYFQRGQMVPEFDEAVFALEPGEMTKEPVQTQFGYHIIKQTDHKKDEMIPYDIVKDTAQNFLLQEKQEKAFKDKIDELKDKYPVELNLGMI